MRTRDQYSVEQRNQWKDKQMSDEVTKVLNEPLSKPRDHLSFSVWEITQTEYNRARNRKGAQFIINRPNMFVVKMDDDMTFVYITTNGKFYKGRDRMQYTAEEYEQKFLKPSVAIHIHMVVAGSRWDEEAPRAA